MGQMLKALRRIEARGPQPPVEDTPEVLPVAGPLAAQAIEAAEAAVAAANAAFAPEAEAAGNGDEPVEGAVGSGSATATPTACDMPAGRPLLADCDGAERPSCGPSSDMTPADPLDAIAGKICAQCSPRAGKVLMFTSPDDEAADGGLVAPLAAALAARIGGDVLLLDGNPQQPDLIGRLGAKPVAGLGDVLRGVVPWHEAIRATSVAGLFLLPGGGPSQFSSERKRACPPAAPAGNEGDSPVSVGARTGTVPMLLPVPLPMSTLLGELSAKYRMVLIAAPSLARPGVANVSRHCRGTYLVVRLHRTSRRAIREAARAIDRGGGRLLGCVAIEPQGNGEPRASARG